MPTPCECSGGSGCQDTGPLGGGDPDFQERPCPRPTLCPASPAHGLTVFSTSRGSPASTPLRSIFIFPFLFYSSVFQAGAFSHTPGGLGHPPPPITRPRAGGPLAGGCPASASTVSEAWPPVPPPPPDTRAPLLPMETSRRAPSACRDCGPSCLSCGAQGEDQPPLDPTTPLAYPLSRSGVQPPLRPPRWGSSGVSGGQRSPTSHGELGTRPGPFPCFLRHQPRRCDAVTGGPLWGTRPPCHKRPPGHNADRPGPGAGAQQRGRPPRPLPADGLSTLPAGRGGAGSSG